MKEQHVTFPAGALTLEGLLAKPDGLKPVRGAVVCHPHPLYGGSMYNNVVDAVLAAMWKREWATLRFNFRGVGESEGEHGGGAGSEDNSVEEIDVKGVRSRPHRATVDRHGPMCQPLFSDPALALLAGRGRMLDQRR